MIWDINHSEDGAKPVARSKGECSIILHVGTLPVWIAGIVRVSFQNVRSVADGEVRTSLPKFIFLPKRVALKLKAACGCQGRDREGAGVMI